jgi:GntR family transcriptional repressor for pyruvate dehydrogenase complex
MGIVESWHGSGTYIPEGPPMLGSEPLSLLAAFHGFTREEMYEARRLLEVGAAGLAAERATPGSTSNPR